MLNIVREDVQLIVRKSDWPVVKIILEKFYDYPKGCELRENTSLFEFWFVDVCFGNLELDGFLQAFRIPYTMSWDTGHEQKAGKQHFRVTECGQYLGREFEAGEEGRVDLNAVKLAFAEGRMEAFLEEASESVMVMSWEDQEAILQGSFCGPIQTLRVTA